MFVSEDINRTSLVRGSKLISKWRRSTRARTGVGKCEFTSINEPWNHTDRATECPRESLIFRPNCFGISSALWLLLCVIAILLVSVSERSFLLLTPTPKMKAGYGGSLNGSRSTDHADVVALGGISP